MVWVVLPVKGFDKSKQRLADVLTIGQRQQLSKAMLQDVLQNVSGSPAVEQVLVVTGNNDIARMAYEYDAQVVMEPAGCQGLNQAADLGVKHAGLHGARQVLVLHADIPLVKSNDITRLIHHHVEGGVTLVPDKHQQGTNGMLIDLPTIVEFCYGEGSFNRHLSQCRDKGLLCDIAEFDDLTLDIDSPEDLLELCLRLIDRPESATSACLRSADMQQAIMDIRSAY